MLVKELIEQIKKAPSTVEFSDVISCIEANYHYTPVSFTNGDASNDAGTNEGSCKIFAFAQLNHLNQSETLALFGTYYRDDVLAHPSNNDHANIRNFMQGAWAGIQFDAQALTGK